MGGTFDPIHYGHLFIAQTALDKLNLDQILFIPTGKPPHKRENTISHGNKRADMINLAIRSNPSFNISTIEIDRDQISYTIDTVRELRQCYSKETQFYFIMGSDAFEYIETWKEYGKLFKLISFIVMTRQVSKNGLLDEKIKLLEEKYHADITKVEIPFLDISSTDIRRRRADGISIKYLLPESVEGYIVDNRLYVD